MIILDQVVYISLHSWTQEITKQASHFRDEEIEDYRVVILKLSSWLVKQLHKGGRW